MPAFTRARAHYPVTRPRHFVRPAGLTAPVQPVGPFYRGIDGFGCECNGGYVYKMAGAPTTPGVGGPFGAYGQTGEVIAGIIGAVATAGATIYQLDLQRRAALTAQHQRERDAAAAAEAAAKAQANQTAMAIANTANAQVQAAASGGGVMSALQGVPTWVWPAAGGGVLLLLLLSRRKAA